MNDESVSDTELKPDIKFLNTSRPRGEKCGEICINLGEFTFYCIGCPYLVFSDFCALEKHLISAHYGDGPVSDDGIRAKKLLKIELLDEDLFAAVDGLDNKNEIQADSVENTILSNPENTSQTEPILIDDATIDKISNKVKTKKSSRSRKRDPSKPKRKGNWNRVYKTVVVDGETKYPCETCDKIFRRKDLLRRHEYLQHNYETKYQCEHCLKRFKTKEALKTHTRYHTGERPYKCAVCEKTFQNAANLANHRIYHLEKNFGCQHCGLKFFSKAHRDIHERIHTGERPYVCDVCGNHFISSSALSTHKKSHLENPPKPHVCHICNSGFLRRNILKRHMKSHSNEKFFTCKFCDVSCKDQYAMVQHLKAHSNSNEYTCKICELEFARYSRVRDHIKFKHGILSKVRSYATYTPIKDADLAGIK